MSCGTQDELRGRRLLFFIKQPKIFNPKNLIISRGLFRIGVVKASFSERAQEFYECLKILSLIFTNKKAELKPIEQSYIK